MAHAMQSQTLATKGRRWFDRECQRIREGGVAAVTILRSTATPGMMSALADALEANVRASILFLRGRDGARDAPDPDAHLQTLVIDACTSPAGALHRPLTAMALSKHLTCLTLSGGTLTADCMPHVALLLCRTPSLRRLSLAGNGVEVDPCVFQALQRASLESLNVSGNLSGSEMLEAFSEAAPGVTSLTSLNMAFCGIDAAGASALRSTIEGCRNLLHLELRENRLGGGIGAAGVGYALHAGGGSALQSLDLEGNDLAFDDTSSLARGMSLNKTLTILKLRGGSNQVTPQDWSTIVARCRTNSRARETRDSRVHHSRAGGGGTLTRRRPCAGWGGHGRPWGYSAPVRKEGDPVRCGGGGFRKARRPEVAAEEDEEEEDDEESDDAQVEGVPGSGEGVQRRQQFVPSPPARVGVRRFMQPVHVGGAAFPSGTAVMAEGLVDKPYAALNGCIGVTRGPVMGVGGSKVEVIFPLPIAGVILPTACLRKFEQKQRVPSAVLTAPPAIKYKVADHSAW